MVLIALGLGIIVGLFFGEGVAFLAPIGNAYSLTIRAKSNTPDSDSSIAKCGQFPTGCGIPKLDQCIILQIVTACQQQ